MALSSFFSVDVGGGGGGDGSSVFVTSFPGAAGSLFAVETGVSVEDGKSSLGENESTFNSFSKGSSFVSSTDLLRLPSAKERWLRSPSTEIADIHQGRRSKQLVATVSFMEIHQPQAGSSLVLESEGKGTGVAANQFGKQKVNEKCERKKRKEEEKI